MVELLFLTSLGRGIKDYFLYTLFSLGKACVCVKEEKSLRFLIRVLIYNIRRSSDCQAPTNKILVSAYK